MLMSYMTQIALWILTSLVIGSFLGYWFRSIRRKEEIETLNKSWKTSYDILKEELVHAQKELSHSEYDAEAESNKVFHNLAATSKPDDLTRIKGIAKNSEERLNSLGIYRYEQIASLTRMEMQEIAQYLGPFPDRVNRDDWKIQAQELATRYYN